MIPAITELYDDVKVWWLDKWPKVKDFFKWIGSMFTAIGDYIDKFDLDGDGSLNADEMKALTDDLTKKISGFAVGLVTSILGAISIFGGSWFVARFVKKLMYRWADTGSFKKQPVPGGGPVKTPSMWSKITSKLGFSKPAMELNKAGRVVYPGGGGYVKGYGKMTAAEFAKIKQPSLLSRLTPFSKSTAAVSTTTAASTASRASVSSAANAAAVQKWFSKHPRLAKWGPRIPWIGRILAGTVAASIILDPEKSDKEKGSALGGLIGGILGAVKMGVIGAGLGGMIGAPGGPLAIGSAALGGIIGSLAGWMGGEWAGRQLMKFLMGGDAPEQDAAFTADDESAQIEKSNRLDELNENIAKEKGKLGQRAPTSGRGLTMYNKRKDRIAGMEKERDSLMSEIESLNITETIPKISYDTPGKMQRYMTEYKQAVTSAGTPWTDDMNKDAYNYAVNQISADQNTNTNVNYYDGSMGVHQRDMPTNILNSELRYAAGYS